MPLPDAAVGEAQETYYWAVYRGHSLRLVALNHPVIGAGEASPVMVVIGETLNSHAAMVQDLLRGAIGQQIMLLAVAAVLVVIGFNRGLAPLMRLREAVLDDQHDDLEPLPINTVHSELRPLVEALNEYKDRVRMQLAARKRFIANAAHQIKTPLTLLSTQAAFAQRARNKADRDEAFSALQAGVRQFAHLVNQLMTLSRAEPGARRPRHELIDLAETAREVLDGFAKFAVARELDLAFERSPNRWW